MSNEEKFRETKPKNTKDIKVESKKERAVSLRDAMNRFFDEPFGSFSDWRLPESGWMPDFPRMVGRVFPKVDISETDSYIEVVADVPGVDADKIKVDIRNGVVTISGEEEYKEEKEGKKYFRYERRYGSFSRSVALPKLVDEERGTAEIKDGVLKITFPKSPEELRKSIKVEVKK